MEEHSDKKIKRRNYFIDKHFSEWNAYEKEKFFNIAQISAGIFIQDLENKQSKPGLMKKSDVSPWKILGKWRIGDSQKEPS